MAIPVPEGWSMPIGGETLPSPCGGGGGGGGTPECPECPPGPLALTVVCCPTPTGCILDCGQPVLIKACNGTPPYFFEGDDEFVDVTQTDVDMAVVSIRLKYTQFIYQLRWERFFNVFSDPEGNCQVVSQHPGATVSTIKIKAVNESYDCSMNLVPNSGGYGPMLVDTGRCCDCACFDDADIPANQCQQETDLPVPTVSGGAAIAFIRTDVVKAGHIHSPWGLAMDITFDGVFCPAFGDPDVVKVFQTGVFVPIQHGPVDVIVTDALDNVATISFTF